jgi:hypothetical protein
MKLISIELPNFLIALIPHTLGVLEALGFKAQMKSLIVKEPTFILAII